MVDLLDEAREAVQQEKLLALVKQYGSLLLLGALAMVVCVASWQWWKARQEAAALQASIAYFTALEHVENNNRAEAEKALSALMQEGPKTYRALSALQLAGLHMQAGKKDEAHKIYQQLTEMGGDAVFADFARLKMLEQQGSSGTKAEGIWRYSHEEWLGLKALEAKDYPAAQKHFQMLTTDPNTPKSLRTRAAEFLNHTTLQLQKQAKK